MNNSVVIDGTAANDGDIGTDYFWIGGYPGDTTSSWCGYVDEVGVWDRALADAEITNLYNSGAGKFYPDWT